MLLKSGKLKLPIVKLSEVYTNSSNRNKLQYTANIQEHKVCDMIPIMKIIAKFLTAVLIARLFLSLEICLTSSFFSSFHHLLFDVLCRFQVNRFGQELIDGTFILTFLPYKPKIDKYSKQGNSQGEGISLSPQLLWSNTIGIVNLELSSITLGKGNGSISLLYSVLPGAIEDCGILWWWWWWWWKEPWMKWVLNCISFAVR